MEIYIGNLPAQVTLFELTSLLEGVALREDLRRHEARDRSDDTYHYFVARANTRDDGLALIEKLNGAVIGGHAIEAREFVRRVNGVDWNGEDRRVNV